MNSSSLNKEQLQAVEHFEGACLIIAVPGSGKTSTLTSRVVRLIERGVNPKNICCVTFTNKAANEMKERILAKCPEANEVWVSTFHKLCLRILKKYGDRVGLRPNFSIYDEDDARSLMAKAHRAECAKTGEESKLSADEKRSLCNRINWLRELGIALPDLRNEEPKLAYYLDEIAAANAVDFSGMMYLTWRLLSKNPDISERLSNRFRFMLIDEVQDTNAVQYAIAKLLASHGNLFMVGDPEQSIFAFRGAKRENIAIFIRDFPELVEISLPRNYRSNAEILQKAANVIWHNKDTDKVQLIAERGSGGSVKTRSFETVWSEAKSVILRIREHHRKGRPWSDIAIIYRLNNIAQEYEIGLSQYGIPCHTRGNINFFSRKEIKTAVSYLRLLENPQDSASFYQALTNPKRGIGEVLIGKIEEKAKTDGVSIMEAAAGVSCSKSSRANIDEFLSVLQASREAYQNGSSLRATIAKLMVESKYHDHLQAEADKDAEDGNRNNRVENLSAFIDGIEEFERSTKKPSLSKFLNQISLVQDGDKNKNPDSVTLLTMHAAKGLEFPVVFVVSCNEDIIPHAKATKEKNMRQREKQIEEERRLFYVALTRAKDELNVSCHSINRRGKVSAPSFFLQEMIGDEKDEMVEILDTGS